MAYDELYKHINKTCLEYFENGLTEDNLFELVDELYFSVKEGFITKDPEQQVKKLED